ncbi:MAG TPA: hypothetical protein VF699_04350 [Caulobacteraceae bacterium]
MTPFFEFLEDRYWLGEPKAVTVGPEAVVRASFAEEELVKTFGGYVTYFDDETARSFLGVFHPPRIEHFYRVLAGKGVAVEVLRERPEKLRLRARTGA